MPAKPTQLAVVQGVAQGACNLPVLQASDFTYLGFYDLNLGSEFSFGQGLTHRYVNGQLRFLAIRHRASGAMAYSLNEIVAPALNGTVSAFSSLWDDIWGGRRGTGNGHFHGIYWNDVTNTLWSTSAIDYPDDVAAVRLVAMAVTSLGASGVVNNVRGLFGMTGIYARQIYGGFTSIPAWFQTQFGVPPYAVGFGGYTSRLVVGAGSMGLSLFAIPDPTSLADGGVLATGTFKTLASHVSGTVNAAWYPAAAVPTTSDRGQRTPDFTETYDTWTTPAPDGKGRWTWGDSAYQTGVWIDLPTKHGFVIVPKVHTGANFYQNSTLNYAGRTAEIQIFNPCHFGEVVRGTRHPSAVQPTSIFRPAEFPTSGSGNGNNTQNTAAGVSYDRLTNRVYIRWTFHHGTYPNTVDRVLVYQVSA